MTTPPAVPPDTVPRPLHRSQFKPILITLLCAVLLTGGSCYGFLNTFNYNGPNKPVANLFMVGFFVGIAGIIAAGVWALVTIVLYFVRAAREEP